MAINKIAIASFVGDSTILFNCRKSAVRHFECKLILKEASR